MLIQEVFVDIATNMRRRLSIPVSWAPLLALVPLLWVGTTMSGQTAPAQQGAPPTQDARDNDTTRSELAGMDRFLDSHPEIAEQLRKDPSLINNREFLEKHSALQDYLKEHPQLHAEFSEYPDAFMRHEESFDRREDNPDSIHKELAGMDRFLDSHPEIAEQLRKDPSLINDREFLEKHPALQDYLKEHPQLNAEFSEHPDAFMRHEERFGRREDDRDYDRDHRIGTDNPDRRGDRDDRGELTSFGRFLGGHSAVAEQLSKDPSLVNNKEYLSNHPELGEYLKTHPAMTEQLAQNPESVMSSNWVQQVSSTGAKAPNPKPKPNQ
jgi:hypothetical protein